MFPTSFITLLFHDCVGLASACLVTSMSGLTYQHFHFHIHTLPTLMSMYVWSCCALFHNSMFKILFGQNIRRIFLKHLLINRCVSCLRPVDVLSALLLEIVISVCNFSYFIFIRFFARKRLFGLSLCASLYPPQFPFIFITLAIY